MSEHFPSAVLFNYAQARGDDHMAHAVAVTRPSRTMCGLEIETSLLQLREEDWEVGSFRTKCTDCIVAVGHSRVA